MASRREVEKRISIVKRSLIMGIPLTQIAEELGISTRQVANYAKKIRQESGDDFKNINIENEITDFLFKNTQLINEAMKLFHKSRHDPSKVGALKLAGDRLDRRLEVLQNLNIIGTQSTGNLLADEIAEYDKVYAYLMDKQMSDNRVQKSTTVPVSRKT